MTRIAASLLALGCAATEAVPDPTPAPPVWEPRLATPTESFARLGPVHVGQPAPWFAAIDARDHAAVWNLTKALSGPDTRALVLVFFATWCEPCRPGLRMIAGSRRRLAAAGVLVLLVSVEEEPEHVGPYLSAMGLGDVPAVIDKFGQAAEAYGIVSGEKDSRVLTLPRTFLIARDQTVRAILGTEGPDYVERLLRAHGP